MEKEIRTLTNKVEIRAASEEDSNTRQIVGYALRFNSWSERLGDFIEIIDPTALDGTDMEDVRALIDHDSSKILGRTVSETLKLSVDEFGLRYEIDLPDTTYARDLVKVMERGDVNQSSFGFTLKGGDPEYENWEMDTERGIYRRTIRKIKDIFDVSVVTYPAYRNTESIVVAQRNLDSYKQETEKRKLKEKLKFELDLLDLLI